MTRLQEFIGKLFGIHNWALNQEGHLDIEEEKRSQLVEKYGEEFLLKFELFLAEQETETKSENNQSQNQKSMKQIKLALLGALLAVESFEADDAGNVTLTEDQLGLVEAGLKDLQDARAAAESDLTAANSARETAETALSGTMTELDTLGETVAGATDPAGKVEAVRTLLAKKPAVAPTGTVGTDDNHPAIEGADEVNEYVKTIV